MSGVAIAWYLLKTNANLVAVVAAEKIHSGETPLNEVLPAISVTEVTDQEYNDIPMNSTYVLARERVRVQVQAKSYPDQKSILNLARKALPNTSGSVNGFTVDSILPDATGPDDYDADAVIYSQTKDFIIKYLKTR